MAERLTPGWRILMTTDAVGGVWDYCLELAAGLASFGVETVLACMGPRPSPEQRTAAAGISGLRLEEGDYRLEWMPEADLEVVRAGRWLLALEDRYRPELIHLNGYAHAALHWQAPCLVVAHSCVLSWWRAVKGEAAPPEWRRYADRVAAGIRAAAVVVAPTAAFLQTLAANYGVEPKGRIIRNGRAPERFTPTAKEELILVAGRLWDEAKNIEALQQVAPYLPWPVAAAGCWRRPEGGGGQPALVQCLGPLPPAAMAGWLGRAAIYALPARYEPFGLSILEAALSGCALVLGDVASLRELWQGAALFVPSEDHERLLQALQVLTASSRLRAHLGREARRRASLYSSQAMLQGYLELYAELISQGRSSGTATAKA